MANVFTSFFQGTDTSLEPINYQLKTTGVEHRHESLSLMFAYFSKLVQSLFEPPVMVDIDALEADDFMQDFGESRIVRTLSHEDLAARPTTSRVAIPLPPNSNKEEEEHSSASNGLGAQESSVSEIPPATLIEGVDTLGFKVYQKIGEGLAQQLQAIARGENVLNLVGHSRGAVECILVAHELERIQKIIQENKSLSNDELKAAILASPKAKTNQAVNTLLKEQLDDSSFLGALRTGFGKKEEGKIEVNIFGIDPVPGGGVHGVNVFAWVDPRFYTLPSIVKDCEIILQQHERSRAFEALLPKVEDPSKTNLTVTKLYGHHGSPTGNPDTQTEAEIENSREENPKTGGVQMITLCRMVDFLRNHGAEPLGFAEAFPKTTYIVQRFLEYVALTTDALRNAFKLEEYNNIEANREVYERFKDTPYGTGAYHSNRDWFWSFFGYDKPQHDRMIRHGNGNDTPLGQIVPVAPHGFVNAEHATLHLEALLQTGDASPEHVLSNIIERIKADPRRLQNAIKAQTTDETKHGQIAEHIAGSIRVIISDLTQTYLRNHISEAKQEDILKTLHAALTMPQVEGDDHVLLNGMITDLKDHLLRELSEAITARVAHHQREVVALQEAMRDAAPDALPALYASVVPTLLELHNMKAHLPHLKAAMPEDMEGSQNARAACDTAILDLSQSFDALWQAHARAFDEAINQQAQEHNEALHMQKEESHQQHLLTIQRLIGQYNVLIQQMQNEIALRSEQLLSQDRTIDDLEGTIETQRADLTKVKAVRRELLAASEEKGFQLLALQTKVTALTKQIGAEKFKAVEELNAQIQKTEEALERAEQNKATAENKQAQLLRVLEEKSQLAQDLQTQRSKTDTCLAECNSTVQQLQDLLSALGLNPDADVPQYGLAFEILGGVMVVGGAALLTTAALAIALMGVSLYSGAALGVGVGLTATGFFSFRHGVQQEHQAALHAQAPPQHSL